ncbi:MAG: DUF721 domain-containing protein [Rhizobiaceae bacterium]
MAGKGRYGNPVPVSDLAGEILDPVLRKRAGISVSLVQSWEEIVGTRLAASTRPEKIAWPRRMRDDDPFEPAVLHIACEGAAALTLQHEAGEIVGRVNAFLGFAAVGRIRIAQKPVSRDSRPRERSQRALQPAETQRLDATVSGVDDPGLRAALQRLGASVLRAKR